MRRNRARLVVLAAALFNMTVLIYATARLGSVFAATPPAVWLVEVPRVVDLAGAVPSPVAERAEVVASFLSDPGLLRGRINPCLATSRPDRDDARCLAVIDDALRASPVSGELWLYKAVFLMRSGELGEPTLEALRRSFRAAPREGWLASERVVFGLRLYPLLPADLQERVRDDAELVMSVWSLAGQFVDTFRSDTLLRRASRDALAQLPKPLFDRFLFLSRTADEEPTAEDL